MAVIQDPQGAFFMLWEKGATFGAEIVNAPGALVWNELSTPDMAGSAAFYSDLFGWSTVPFEDSPEPYLGIRNGEHMNGGIRELAGPAPPNWLVYFGVPEIEAAVARVGELGGATIVAPVDIGVAKIAVVQDPQGAPFALYAGQMEP
jgi:predicted enzyme related to lactoylglutathione lyase